MLNEIKVYFIVTNENEIDALMIKMHGTSILNARIILYISGYVYWKW